MFSFLKGKKAFLCAILMTFISSIGVSASARHSGDITFAVFSDPHLYDGALGTEGSAFEAYLAQDRKLIRESEAILDAAIESILDDDRVRFVIVPGDLTKDGELRNHIRFYQKMKNLERKFKRAGLKVFVVPGNHDINNPHAYRYDGEDEIPVPNVSPRMFKTIYRNFGYKEALYEDPHSLSYVAEPVRGLWLIAMDPCIYDNNMAEGKPATGGEFKPETLRWILHKVAKGRALGKRMIGMMHHGVLEHYAGQSVAFPEYVVKDWPIVSQQLAEAGLKVVFTGHYHANDVVKRDFDDGNFLFDVETGSLVTYPNPYRTVTLTPDNLMKVRSHFIEEIDYDTGGLPFPEYAQTFLMEGLQGIVFYTLTLPPALGGYGLLPNGTTESIAGQIAQAFAAHYAGDERVTENAGGFIELLSKGDRTMQMLGSQLESLWTDIKPEDTELVIDLNTGNQIPNDAE